MVSNSAEIRTQIEYYLSDKNLIKDKFFREQIQTAKDGYIELAHFLNCKKVQAAKWTKEDIKMACSGSEELELKGDTIRRKGNRALPDKQQIENKKRDQKAQEKREKLEQAEDEFDQDGKIILHEKDFENPIIVTFEAKTKDLKVDWKSIEKAVREAHPKLKLIYSRKEENTGQLAFSQLRLRRENLDALKTLKIDDINFTFKVTEGEDLKEFWQKHGGHFNFCIQNKVRAVKKAQKARQQEKRETVKRAKVSYEIAGVYYLDINKVKSKSRAILNLKQDGEKVEGNDSDFLKELLSFHEKKDQKLKDFSHFAVGTHPEHEKTRCFFVVRKDGSKEDFSITKCILQLEAQA